MRTLEELFQRTKREGSCLIWTGKFSRDGYAKLRSEMVHRIVYTLAYGEIPPEYHVDHICWVRACVEPTHLRVLPAMENRRRQRSALKTECIHGHPFDERNTAYRKSSPTSRQCRKCAAESTRKYLAKRKAA